MRVLLAIFLLIFLSACEESSSSSSSDSSSVTVESKGTSSSKFKIKNDRLYSIKDDILKVYDISEPQSVYPLSQTFLGFSITGMFIYDETLIAASSSGLKVFSLNGDNITFLANSDDFIPCQRFFVDGSLLFVLNNLEVCENYLNNSYNNYYYESTFELEDIVVDNGIEVYDISEFLAPKLLTKVSSYNPVALSVQDDTLYVCEGEYGLKVYDINRSDNNISLNKNNTYRNAPCEDLITASNYLYGINPDGLDIYDYNELNVTAGSLR